MAVRRKITTRLIKSRFKNIRNKASLTRAKQSLSKKTFGIVKPKKISDKVAKGYRAVRTKAARKGTVSTIKKTGKRIAKRTAVIGGIGAGAVGAGYVAGRRRRKRNY